MPSLNDLLQPGAASPWLFIPLAVLLGALHGLEPGHSKTMMAAFIIAVRGTVGQAILLGLSATFSHTLIVWIVALCGMHFGDRWSADRTDPYFHQASAVLIVGIALWMLWRTLREQQSVKNERYHRANPTGEEMRRIDTGHGLVTLEVFEKDVPPRWRLRVETGHHWPAKSVKVETLRSDNQRQMFSFADHGDYLESIEEIPEPHEFTARLRLSHGSHDHGYDVSFHERAHHHGDAHDHGSPRHAHDHHAHGHQAHGHHDHDHGTVHHHDHDHAPHATPGLEVLDVLDGGQHDAHELAHANDIRRRFTGGGVTTGQIVMFGLTGGLIPCPAAITVLLLCLQVQQFALGVALVLAFSIGLGITMVTAGVIASVSVKHVTRRWSGFGKLARRAPYFSSTAMLCIGLLVASQAFANRGAGTHHHHAVFWPFATRP